MAEVQVKGVKELRRDLIRLFDDKGASAIQLKAAGRLSAEPVAGRVRAALPQRTGKLVSTVRVGATRTGANIRVGKARVPYAGPVDFGGWPHGRPFLPSGRYLYPAARAEAPHVVERYSEALQTAIDMFHWSRMA